MGTVELKRGQHAVEHLIDREIQSGEELLASTRPEVDDVMLFRAQYLEWSSRASATLETSFATTGFMTTSPKDEFTATAVSLLDLQLSTAAWTPERVPEVVGDVKEKIRVLRAVRGRLDLYVPMVAQVPKQQIADDTPIFLVHGRDVARRETVRRFLERVTERKVIVLDEHPNRGQDILGKLLSKAQDAAFAVVLLTPDDVGGLDEGSSQPRARQNVVFELGLFIGLLGRHRVAALNDSAVELPTDFSGVAYIPLDNEAWQMHLVRELKAADIQASLDRAL